ncbi:uncharacterized protein LOC116610249 [Nematostella vectensis]|uniref:uncharacterized protein LOC116610249 n=1 Tax=Nematostella vectensis TaxID=45351 RepID=UPI0020776921|nr:uncharacterized protein LOC116610249 [Nematostella vectensis]
MAEDPKDDYLKKKLHIKDRFIKRLECENRQLEIDKTSLERRLQHLEQQLYIMLNGPQHRLATDPQHRQVTGPQHRQATGTSMRLIDISPAAYTFAVSEQNSSFLPETENLVTAFDNGQLFNENLESTLEISYLKARLKSSEAARAVAERKCEILEEKLRSSGGFLNKTGSTFQSNADQMRVSTNECQLDRYATAAKPVGIAMPLCRPQTAVTCSRGSQGPGAECVRHTDRPLEERLDGLLSLIVGLDDKISGLTRRLDQASLDVRRDE